MEIKVINISGEETGAKVQLPESIFGVEPNDHAIYLDVKQYLANKRHGTHKAKHRGEVSGSTRKIRKQKGTGAARAGSIKNPIFRGGGRIFGPTPRDYSFKLNKKLKKLARRSALSYKASENNVVVLDAVQFDSAKTKNYINLINALNIADERTLLLLPEADKNIYLSSRNLKKAKVLVAKDVNTYELMKASKLLLTEDSVKSLEESLAN
ncbi:MAG TPA: 50S ribosomal protein L4 [Sphingobacterium sp.]|nr:50S ribosomal protein L4 [Sphingobacterium sp.]